MRPRPTSVRVIAHRGASRDRPENTLAAFDEALRQGADGIELDLQLSRDGVPVVYHDRTLARAGGGRRRVAACELTELQRLDPAPGGPHIPTLERVLERYGGRTELLLELKAREGAGGRERHERLARTVARMIDSRGLHRDVSVLSFELAMLAACRDEAPRLRTVLNLRPPASMTRTIRRRLAGLDALSADVRSLTPAFGASVRRIGLPLFVYTCNGQRTVARALAGGATAVMSDRPAWLAARLRAGRGADEA
jgi:glycerophosphoryl diester phosphodiesterase